MEVCKVMSFAITLAHEIGLKLVPAARSMEGVLPHALRCACVCKGNNMLIVLIVV
jgi:hypothetical protein